VFCAAIAIALGGTAIAAARDRTDVNLINRSVPPFRHGPES
jgi:hypothetical protein